MRRSTKGASASLECPPNPLPRRHTQESAPEQWGADALAAKAVAFLPQGAETPHFLPHRAGPSAQNVGAKGAAVRGPVSE